MPVSRFDSCRFSSFSLSSLHKTHFHSSQLPTLSANTAHCLIMAKREPWIVDDVYGFPEVGHHKWAESEYSHASAVYLDANFEEAFKIDDVSSVFHYEPIARLDGQSSNMTGERNYECRVSGGLLCEDEITNLALAVCFPRLSEDQIWDVDFAKNVPELPFKFRDDDELSFGNSRSAINSPETSNDVVDVSEFAVPLPKGLRSSDCERHDIVGRNVGRKCSDETLIEEGTLLNRSIVIGTQLVDKASDKSYIQSNEVNLENQLIKADLSVNYLMCNEPFGGEMVRFRPKRLCHPPLKYTEELPMWKRRTMSKPKRGRPKKYPMTSSNDKDLGVTSQKKGPVKSFLRKELKVSETNLESDSDDDYNPNVSSFRSKKYNGAWTLDEVVKVVDGVAHYGQGKWTAIQRTFFTSSCRTPTDIRDKWRNLVKTHCGILKYKKDKQLNKRFLPLPNAIIERVRELANS